MTKTKERPILFSGEMVRAVLDGRKTQTRRVLKMKGSDSFIGAPRIIRPCEIDEGFGFYSEDEYYLCPYGAPGDMLWVRETWATSASLDNVSPSDIRAGAEYAGYGGDDPLSDLWYMADMHYRQWGDEKTSLGRSRPSIHMPRWASRIQLEITDIRVERVQDISERDMVAEGIALKDSDYAWEIRDRFSQEAFFGFDIQQRWIDLWNSINEKRGFGWDANPWVWVVEFRRVIKT